ncbi:hypothetical protein M513_04430 [Trichuris suis]|uniref:Uncharacterized protein n=1 Tax=Trichuris suis TaxID=68888 RepID=A0A085LR75_9BILA|nr:hypothetical protein M513_11632 [Trichuris suis]KFD54730.1 hypothetical protein M513_04430 [Trichuris suis]
MGDIHPQPLPYFFHVQPPVPPPHRRRVDGLAGLTVDDDLPNLLPRHSRAYPPGEIERSPHAGMACVMVNLGNDLLDA